VQGDLLQLDQQPSRLEAIFSGISIVIFSCMRDVEKWTPSTHTAVTYGRRGDRASEAILANPWLDNRTQNIGLNVFSTLHLHQPGDNGAAPCGFFYGSFMMAQRYSKAVLIKPDETLQWHKYQDDYMKPRGCQTICSMWKTVPPIEASEKFAVLRDYCCGVPM